MEADNLNESYREFLEGIYKFFWWKNSLLTYLSILSYLLHNWSIFNAGKLERILLKKNEISYYLTTQRQSLLLFWHIIYLVQIFQYYT